MSKLLITGGAGFIGSNFVRYMLADSRMQVINLDKLTYAGNLENLRDIERQPNYRFIQGDICDAVVVEKIFAQGIDFVVNFAAETHVDRSVTDPSTFIKTDVYGTYVLLEAARKYGVKRFLQVSTDEVYGEAEEELSRETSALMPKSPYAASKAGADRLAFSYYATYGTPVVITRCSNNFGPYQYPEKIIPLFITNALEDKPLPVYGDGMNRRDWIYVLDHCRAIRLLLEAEGIEGEVFNVGARQEITNLDLTRLILKYTGKPESLINFIKDRPGHVRRHAIAVDKIYQRLGWQAQTPFEEGLRQTVEWYKQNTSWWGRLKSGEYLEYYRKQYELR